MPATVITIFLRGGADSLALVPPIGEDTYHRLRPASAVPRGHGVPLDGRFVLHEDLAELQPVWDGGRLSIVPACGIPDATRSHFYAQDWLEQGGEGSGGWLARWLSAQSDGNGPMAAVAIGERIPLALTGAPTALPLGSADALAWPGEAGLPQRFAALCAGDPWLDQPARDALETAHRLSSLTGEIVATRARAAYPDTGLSHGLATVSALIRADVGLRAATLDLPGWDTHIAQEQTIGGNRRELAGALAAFARDLGSGLDQVSVVVFTEFGRRVEENASSGTDHGRAGCAMVLGGGTPGGIRGAWPGLDHLEDPGDMPVANDLRDVLREVLLRHGPVPERLFPGLLPVAVGV